MFTFNPVQIDSFGGKFHKGENFKVRYILGSRFGGLFKTIFIPLGPNFKNSQGLYEFIEWCNSKKLTKIIIELPLILDPDFKNECKKIFLSEGFHSEPYSIHDEETLLIESNCYELDSKTARKVRYADVRSTKILVESNAKEQKIDDAYKVYLDSAQRIGFNPKKIQVFKDILRDGLMFVAYDKDTENPIGFILGTFFKLDCKGNEKKICYITLSGTNDKGRDNKIGYLLRDELIKTSFDQYSVDFVDQGGAGRKANFSYLYYKRQFGGKFVGLGGRFVRGYKLI